MKKWKQALALVLALVMALSLVALPSFAADEDASGSGTAASDGPAWPNEGAQPQQNGPACGWKGWPL